MALSLTNLDVVWNGSRAFAREFREHKEWADAPLPPSSKSIILTVNQGVDFYYRTRALDGVVAI